MAKSEYLHKEPCPKCGSGDNLARYADGSAYCFSQGCTYREKPEGAGSKDGGRSEPSGGVRKGGRRSSGDLIQRKPDCYDHPIISRGITTDTLRRFSYFPTRINGKVAHVAPYFDVTGREVAQKVRFTEKKDFVVLTADDDHEFVTGWLFGRHLWGDSQHKRVSTSKFRSRVVIVEGEIDCLTVAQVTKFQVCVVSIPAGVNSARKSIAANLDWLDQFDEIVLALDDDEPGRAAAEECAPLFPAGKLKICTWGEEHKDANGLLMAKRPGDITLAIERASSWGPPGTITGATIENLLREAEAETLAPPITFPWKGMSKKVSGAFRQFDAIVLLAGSGVGKTTFLCECMAHWMDEGHKIAGIFLEDLPVGVADGLLTVATNERLRLDPRRVTAERKIELFRERGWSEKLFIEDPNLIAKTKESLYAKIRYLVGTRDVSIVIVDPLSFLVSKAVTDSDERRAIDHMMVELSDLARALRVTILMSHHLSRPEGNISHEEGAAVSLKHARGSHGIAMFAANILALEAPRKKEQESAARVVIKKSRWRGELRDEVVSHLEFDGDTGRLYEVKPNERGASLEHSSDDGGGIAADF